ncbi:MAG: cytidylate kinase family protein [Candidatus Diapherotrites archaeon]|nr:cytidylate kinase family protein [Candidatus Diapherotrites archaeon]
MAFERLVIVSGLAGSGKSTLAKKIAKEFNLKIVHASDILKKMKNKNIKKVDVFSTEPSKGWWESKEAKKYLQQRLQEKRFDLELDKKLLEIAKRGNVVLDSKTMGYLCKRGIKIWLKASVKVRAERIAARDNLKVEDVMKSIKLRDSTDATIYKKLYGFDLGKNLENFNLVIDTEKLAPARVFEIARLFLESNLE